jgi:hypothetical protein
MGTFGRVEIACRAPGSDTVEGKTAEWKSKRLRAYQRRPEANSFRRAEELRPKCESRRSAPKLAAEGDHAGAAIWRRSQSRSSSLPTRRDH